jgi:hypothetical protein
MGTHRYLDTITQDIDMLAVMALGAVMCCMAGLVVMNMVFGVPDDFEEARDDPDFELYTQPGTTHWSEEIDYYGERLNQSMFPICCHEFGEGQEWGDIRR